MSILRWFFVIKAPCSLTEIVTEACTVPSNPSGTGGGSMAVDDEMTIDERRNYLCVTLRLILHHRFTAKVHQRFAPKMHHGMG